MIVATTPYNRFPITLSTRPIRYNNEILDFINFLINTKIPIDCPGFLLNQIDKIDTNKQYLDMMKDMSNIYTVRLKNENDALFFKMYWC